MGDKNLCDSDSDSDNILKTKNADGSNSQETFKTSVSVQSIGSNASSGIHINKTSILKKSPEIHRSLFLKPDLGLESFKNNDAFCSSFDSWDMLDKPEGNCEISSFHSYSKEYSPKGKQKFAGNNIDQIEPSRKFSDYKRDKQLKSNLSVSSLFDNDICGVGSKSTPYHEQQLLGVICRMKAEKHQLDKKLMGMKMLQTNLQEEKHALRQRCKKLQMDVINHDAMTLNKNMFDDLSKKANSSKEEIKMLRNQISKYRQTMCEQQDFICEMVAEKDKIVGKVNNLKVCLSTLNEWKNRTFEDMKKIKENIDKMSEMYTDFISQLNIQKSEKLALDTKLKKKEKCIKKLKEEKESMLNAQTELNNSLQQKSNENNMKDEIIKENNDVISQLKTIKYELEQTIYAEACSKSEFVNETKGIISSLKNQIKLDEDRFESEIKQLRQESEDLNEEVSKEREFKNIMLDAYQWVENDYKTLLNCITEMQQLIRTLWTNTSQPLPAHQSSTIAECFGSESIPK
uniref:Uncharacterized protein n=1 Tax=Octopus bimaculoides TaxID=37653 RepID=A0A0L8H023_OCTBM